MCSLTYISHLQWKGNVTAFAVVSVAVVVAVAADFAPNACSKCNKRIECVHCGAVSLAPCLVDPRRASNSTCVCMCLSVCVRLKS